MLRKIFFPLVASCVVSFSVWAYSTRSAESLYNSKANSPYVYFYKITNEEALRFMKGVSDTEVYDLLHSKVDSIPNIVETNLLKPKSLIPQNLPNGHYLLVRTENNLVKVNLHTQTPYVPYVLNNGRDFLVRVLDTLGNNVSNATIALDKKLLKYDKKLQYYAYNGKAKKGILSISIDGITTYFSLFERSSLFYHRRLPNPSSSQKNEDNWTVVAVSSQPKYRVGDTLRFKLYVYETKSQKMIKDSIRIFLSQQENKKLIGTYSPYSDGLFEGKIELTDSLGFFQNQGLNLCVESASPKAKSNHRAIDYSFCQLEDYELKSSTLKVEVSDQKIWHGDTLRLVIRGEDENELPLVGAKVNVKLLRHHFSVPTLVYRNTYFPKENLFELDTMLATNGPTEVLVPTKDFPKANYSYSVAVEMTTAEGETRKNTCSVSHIYQDFLNENEKTQNENDSLELIPTRTEKSVSFECKNPRKIKFNYFVFQGEKLLKKGITDNFRFKIREKLNKDVSVSVHYVYNKKMRQKEFVSPYVPNDGLNLKVIQEPRVFPGQTATITLETSRKGKPVGEVDILAWAPTSKFKTGLPFRFPDWGQSTVQNKFKKLRYDLSLVNLSKNHTYKMRKLDTLFFGRIDSVERYKFLYPDTPYYATRAKSEVSQILPFIMCEGEQIPVHIVYVDKKPSYISFVSNKTPYAARVTPGRHQIWVRTKDYMFDLGIITVEQGEKLILSIDQNKWQEKVPYPQKLTESEQVDLARYLLSVDQPIGGAYLYQDESYFSLENTRYSKNGMLIAPIEQNREMVYVVDEEERKFMVYPETKYNLSNPDTITTEYTEQPLGKFSSYVSQSDRDSVWSHRRLMMEHSAQKARILDQNRRSFDRVKWSDETVLNTIDLSRISYKKDSLKMYNPLNIIALDKDSSVVAVLGASHNVRLPQGDYILMSLFDTNEFAYFDVSVKNDSTLFVYDSLQVYQPTTKSCLYNQFLNMLTQRLRRNSAEGYEQERVMMNQKEEILSAYLNHLKAEKDTLFTVGDLVGGFVRDRKGNGIAGATVVVLEYKAMLKTDFSGFFSFKKRNDLPITLQVESEEKRMKRVYLEPMKSSKEQPALDIVLSSQFGDYIRYEYPKELAINVDEKEMEELSYDFIEDGVRYNKNALLFSAPREYSISAVTEEFGDIQVKGVSSSSSKPLYVVDGKIVSSIDSLSPTDIKTINVLKKVPTMYAGKGGNGVIVITTYKNSLNLVDEDFMTATNDEYGMRNNFSDCAFWQPRLTTDKEGKLKFNVTYPDDITRWHTMFLAVSPDVRTATYEADVMSYKPLMGQLSLPRFLLQGDESSAICKLRNVTAQGARVKSQFLINNVQIGGQKSISIKAKDGVVESYPLLAQSTDSLRVAYRIDRADGYFDGEERSIAVYRKGIEQKNGVWGVLRTLKDSVVLDLPKGKNTELHVYSKEMEVLEQEIDLLLKYDYECNEQLASKLVAMLLHQQRMQSEGKRFSYEKEVKNIIKKLAKNQNENGGWGWYGKVSDDEEWITIHVLKALSKARSVGYDVHLPEYSSSLTAYIQQLIAQPQYGVDLLNYLEALLEIDETMSTIDYKTILQRIDRQGCQLSSAYDRLRLIRIKQRCGVKYDLSDLNLYRRTNLLGSVYYANSTTNLAKRFPFWEDNRSMTLLAYEILAKHGAKESELSKIRSWFYEQRTSLGWGNTYVSSNVINTLFSSAEQADKKVASVILKGAVNDRTLDLPKTYSYNGGKIVARKRGDAPVYLSAVQKEWIEKPQIDTSLFVLNVRMPDTMKVGEEKVIDVDLSVKKDADFVKIEVPIPAGCSVEATNYRLLYLSHEVHREVMRDRVVIYCRTLPIGKYHFTIRLNAKFAGKYFVNPSTAEMMYFPMFKGVGEAKNMVVLSEENR